jgi:DNA-binding MarR family transcriptional regulator
MADMLDGQRLPLFTLFLRAAHGVVEELVARLAAAGYPDIRPADSRAFENLDPGGTRLTELAARAQMTHQSMGELVTGLVARGYLERRPDPSDRRARLVALTPRGRAMMRVALAEIAAIEATWFPDSGPCAGGELRATLERGLRGPTSHPEAERPGHTRP